jgi:AcrR family transcriptional regulator
VPKRAGGALEKEARKMEILAFADTLFREKDLDEIRMADLAAELGLAKGTLYLYFPSKEALFLELLEERLRAAFAGLASGLSGADERPDIEKLSVGLAEAISVDPALPRLLADLHPTLERKLPFEDAVAFKRRLRSSLGEAGDRLAAAFPPLSGAEAFRFLLQVYAQVIGLVSVTELSPFACRVSAQNGLEALRIDFTAALADFCRAMLAQAIEAARRREKGASQ